MDEHQNIPTPTRASSSFSQENTYCDLSSQENKEVASEPKIIQINTKEAIKSNTEDFLFNDRETKIAKEPPAISYQNANLFRLFVKNGKYVYARPNDIIMMESCGHLVKVYLCVSDKIKKTIRYNTLKDLLVQLPNEQFLRVGRFCAINIYRLSGGNCNDQTFEFDFTVSIKLNHALSQSVFGHIGK
jgi:hypothetical protein